jgi:hypothetical protein
MIDERFERRKQFIIEQRKKFREGMKELRKLQKQGDNLLKILQSVLQVAEGKIGRLEKL